MSCLPMSRHTEENDRRPPSQVGSAQFGLDSERETTMRQVITENHRTDQNGNPTGGTTEAVGIKINWQDGPLGRGTHRKEPNGAFVEGVIATAIGRLKFYNSGKFSCRENSLAITHLEEALHCVTLERETAKPAKSKERT